MQEIKHSSLTESVSSSIGDFLYFEKFQTDPIVKEGILALINLISDYHEEGHALFPEVLITNDLEFFKSIPNKEILINEAELSVDEFKDVVKLCAPLAINNWIIFIEIKDKKLKYGLVSAEMSDTSPSLYNQTVGALKEEIPNTTIAYIKSLGQKTVELAGLSRRLIISLNLEDPKGYSQNEVHQLSSMITEKCDEHYRVNINTFFEKIIDEALKAGHGNLIGIVEDQEDVIMALKEKLNVNGGVYLPMPIDFEELIVYSEQNKDNESSINLRAHSSILKAMLNHDGITIITNKGRVIGYHLLIDPYVNEGDVLRGGTRSKAYLSMQNCKFFKCCFYKSQDGNIKIWKNE
ncbi:hypothetical protein HQN86_01440 [Pedobacter panaciterrae]|uniref:hypothetical protein n=1 Tax=Pedobacter panaciterrae TaxID=363849 RepID=UPI00155D9A8F|nr:hypothetical protein [Pedobacter panaciterrae]NQX52267.1 hypothetical protein [Pedobacter panaciterrae]